MAMTLQDLVDETLMQKHQRIMRERCCHPADATVISTFVGPEGAFTDIVCLNCGQLTRHEAAQ